MIHAPALAFTTTIDDLPMHEVSLDPSLLRDEPDRNRVHFTNTVFGVQKELRSVLKAEKNSGSSVLPDPPWVDELMDLGSFNPKAAMKVTLGEHRYEKLEPNLGTLERLFPRAGTVNHS